MKVVFLDEQDFDAYSSMLEEDDYLFEYADEYEGFSDLDVYEIPDYDEESVDSFSDERWDYKVVGSVTVGFNEGEGTIVDRDDLKGRIELAYPTL